MKPKSVKAKGRALQNLVRDRLREVFITNWTKLPKLKEDDIKSQTMGMSAVQGHYHTKFLISYWANPDNLFFAMNVGCLINQKSLAFAYAKNFRTRFIIGSGIIIDGIPRLLPLVLNNKGDWIGKLV